MDGRVKPGHDRGGMLTGCQSLGTTSLVDTLSCFWPGAICL